MDPITIASQMAIPELDTPEGLAEFIKDAQDQHGVSVVKTDIVENGMPVYHFKGTRDAIQAMFEKLFEGGEWNLDDFERVSDGDESSENIAPSSGEETPPAVETEVVDTTDGTNPNEEEALGKALEELDEETRNRLLARFRPAPPAPAEKPTEGNALAKVIKSLRI